MKSCDLLPILDEYPLKGAVNIEFADAEFTLDLSSAHRTHYLDWVVGMCLIELEQYLQRYLANLSNTAEDVVHGLEEHKLKSFQQPTKSSSYYLEQLYKTVGRLGDIGEVLENLTSIKEARNCLAHNSGIIDSRRAGPDGVFRLMWHAPMLISEKDGETTYHRDEPFVSDGSGHSVSSSIMRLEHRYAVGEKIQLSPRDLLDLTLFTFTTGIAADRVLSEFVENYMPSPRRKKRR